MSIPLDRLYHYIESVARDIRGDNVLIYHFYPHGSKNLEDLVCSSMYNLHLCAITPQIYCYDQEPLNYEYYNTFSDMYYTRNKTLVNIEPHRLEEIQKNNIRHQFHNVYDKCILLHSEKRSSNLDQYARDQYIPVYYWSHALISLDWFRYAQHVFPKKDSVTTQFLIYNRAWSGTREYRLKFVDLLIEHGLINNCKTWFNSIEPELQIPYYNHELLNLNWKPTHQLEKFLTSSNATSASSADINYSDYCSTDFEVVLETLFDDNRIQLTEKILRPIAYGQPFLLASTHGSLQYLRDYGFKTFNPMINEDYDLIADPVERLQSLINSMKEISNWTDHERNSNMKKIAEIVNFNRKYFFSDTFFNLIVNELKENLTIGLNLLENTNTSKRYIEIRKSLAKNHTIKNTLLTASRPTRTREDLKNILGIARTYYNRYLKTLNK